jgi:hypothetical protein
MNTPGDEAPADVGKDKFMMTVVSHDPAITPERSPLLKARQQAMWASGDFAVVGTTASACSM